MAVNPELLKILVCPLCKAKVSVVHDDEGLKCSECNRVYPIRDDIPVMLVTRGGEGCDLFQADGQTFHIPACPLKDGIHDPSGAGDAFRAGFGFGRVRDWPWLASAQLASTAAAFALEARGTQGHKFNRTTLLERCQQIYGPLPSELLSTV